MTIVILDFDGTLASSIEGITVCMGRALTKFGYESPSVDRVRTTVGLTLEESIRRLTEFKCPESDISEIVRTYRELHITEAAPLTKLFAGVAETLSRIKAANLKTVLVSNKGYAGLTQLLEQLELSQHFDLVLSADRVKHHKPSAGLYDFHIAPEFPNVPRRQVLVVGDTESDLLFAANIGAQSCWAAYGYGDRKACSALHPNFTISAAPELISVLGLTSGNG